MRSSPLHERNPSWHSSSTAPTRRIPASTLIRSRYTRAIPPSPPRGLPRCQSMQRPRGNSTTRRMLPQSLRYRDQAMCTVALPIPPRMPLPRAWRRLKGRLRPYVWLLGMRPRSWRSPILPRQVTRLWRPTPCMAALGTSCCIRSTTLALPQRSFPTTT